MYFHGIIGGENFWKVVCEMKGLCLVVYLKSQKGGIC